MSVVQRQLLGREYRLLARVECAEESETFAFAASLSKVILPGQIVALTGDLGAGKTTLVRAWAQTLGLGNSVHSPTYALVHSYGNPPLIHHLDLYRLSSGTDWNELGMEEWADTEAVTFIEWPERLPLGTRFDHWVDIRVRIPQKTGNPEADFEIRECLHYGPELTDRREHFSPQ